MNLKKSIEVNFMNERSSHLTLRDAQIYQFAIAFFLRIKKRPNMQIDKFANPVKGNDSAALIHKRIHFNFLGS